MTKERARIRKETRGITTGRLGGPERIEGEVERDRAAQGRLTADLCPRLTPVLRAVQGPTEPKIMTTIRFARPETQNMFFTLCESF